VQSPFSLTPNLEELSMNESDVVHEHRLGVVAVFVENRLETAPKVNQILSEYAGFWSAAWGFRTVSGTCRSSPS